LSEEGVLSAVRFGGGNADKIVLWMDPEAQELGKIAAGLRRATGLENTFLWGD